MPRTSSLLELNENISKVLNKYYKSLKYTIEETTNGPTVYYGSSYNYYRAEDNSKLKCYELIDNINDELILLNIKPLAKKTILKYLATREIDSDILQNHEIIPHVRKLRSDIGHAHNFKSRSN